MPKQLIACALTLMSPTPRNQNQRGAGSDKAPTRRNHIFGHATPIADVKDSYAGTERRAERGPQPEVTHALIRNGRQTSNSDLLSRD